MRTIQPIGPYRDVVEARSPLNLALVVKLGLREDSFQQLLRNNLATAVAQYYGIVQDGLLHAVHAFQGLKRPLMHGEDMEADKSIIVYSWRSDVDFVWSGSRFSGNPVRKTPPPNRVFVVLVREEHNDSGIFGSIERWNWVREDPIIPHAPLNWEERYATKLWSKSIL
jgi:hypothetical protein